MLRKLLDYQLSLTEKGKPLHKIRPLITAGDTFFYEAPEVTKKGPHIRDAVDLKRWMSMVILALIPCILMAMWNTGVQKFVYSSGDYRLLDEFVLSSTSFSDYIGFVTKDSRYLTILQYGVMAFVPVMIISYAVGGICEGIFAVIRGHEIAEGFLVTGMLYPLVLPPTIPYWQVAVGVAAGVIISKELFGGTGMNIVNPALTCRAFLFFTFPSKMSGDVWIGTNPTVIRESIGKMNTEAGLAGVDSYTQATPLALFNINDDIKRVHVDAIATNTRGANVPTYDTIKQQFSQWNGGGELGSLNPEQMENFVTTPLTAGGLGLAPENYEDAFRFSTLNFGEGHFHDGNLFFGNMIGCMGETSVIASLIGAIVLIYTGVGSWRSMAGFLIGAFVTALLFQLGSTAFGAAFAPAKFGFPAYKHLIIGGLAFGLVFMITDPVSSPGMQTARWFYGLLVGCVAVVIRNINPAFPEGVMLAILLGNVFAPLIDYYVVENYRNRRTRLVQA